MAENSVLTVTDDDFEQIINNSQIPVLIYFWAEWCLPCKINSPLVDEFAVEYEGKIKFAKLDADISKETLKKYKVFSIPTVMIFRNGVEMERAVGSKHKDEFKKIIQKYA